MEQDFVARTALDEMVESDRNQMLKAMIPYLPASPVVSPDGDKNSGSANSMSGAEYDNWSLLALPALSI